jgi:hypothetical protein
MSGKGSKRRKENTKKVNNNWSYIDWSSADDTKYNYTGNLTITDNVTASQLYVGQDPLSNIEFTT